MPSSPRQTDRRPSTGQPTHSTDWHSECIIQSAAQHLTPSKGARGVDSSVSKGVAQASGALDGRTSSRQRMETIPSASTPPQGLSSRPRHFRRGSENSVLDQRLSRHFDAAASLSVPPRDGHVSRRRTPPASPTSPAIPASPRVRLADCTNAGSYEARSPSARGRAQENLRGDFRPEGDQLATTSSAELKRNGSTRIRDAFKRDKATPPSSPQRSANRPDSPARMHLHNALTHSLLDSSTSPRHIRSPPPSPSRSSRRRTNTSTDGPVGKNTARGFFTGLLRLKKSTTTLKPRKVAISDDKQRPAMPVPSEDASTIHNPRAGPTSAARPEQIGSRSFKSLFLSRNIDVASLGSKTTASARSAPEHVVSSPPSLSLMPLQINTSVNRTVGRSSGLSPDSCLGIAATQQDRRQQRRAGSSARPRASLDVHDGQAHRARDVQSHRSSPIDISTNSSMYGSPIAPFSDLIKAVPLKLSTSSSSAGTSSSFPTPLSPAPRRSLRPRLTSSNNRADSPVSSVSSAYRRPFDVGGLETARQIGETRPDGRECSHGAA